MCTGVGYVVLLAKKLQRPYSLQNTCTPTSFYHVKLLSGSVQRIVCINNTLCYVMSKKQTTTTTLPHRKPRSIFLTCDSPDPDGLEWRGDLALPPIQQLLYDPLVRQDVHAVRRGVPFSFSYQVGMKMFLKRLTNSSKLPRNMEIATSLMAQALSDTVPSVGDKWSLSSQEIVILKVSI